MNETPDLSAVLGTGMREEGEIHFLPNKEWTVGGSLPTKESALYTVSKKLSVIVLYASSLVGRLPALYSYIRLKLRLPIPSVISNYYSVTDDR